MLGTVVAGEDGRWSYTPDALDEGSHSLSTTVTDKAGNVSERSPAFDLTVDTVVTPVSDLQVTDDVAGHTGPLTSGDLTNDATPALSGTAEAGATVTIYDGDTVLGTVVAGEDGRWSYTPDTLNEGDHSLSTTVTDKAGNVSERSPAFELTVDTVVTPVSDLQVTDDVAGHTGPLASGDLTNDATPALSGTAEAGATVTIYDGDTVLGTVVTGEDGRWTFTPDTLNEGDHSLSTTVTDKAGNVSERSPAFELTVDTNAPSASAPEVTDDVAGHTGPLTSGDLTNDATPALSGTAEAGATVTIYDGDTVLGTVVAGEDGRWSYTPDALDEGSHSLSTTVTDKAGNVSERSPAFEITVDTTVTPVSDLQVTDDVAGHTGPLASGDLTNDATPALSGTAEAGATVTIYDGDTVLGTVVAGEDGRWTFTPDTLNEGDHSLSTTVTDKAGNVSERSPAFELTVDTVVTPVSDLLVTDDVAGHTGPLTSGDLTNDATPALSGTAEAGATVTIYDGDTVLGTVVAGEDGRWSFTPDTLNEGDHRLSTTVTDKAGNVSERSPAFELTVDTIVNPVSDLQVTDNAGEDTGTLNSGNVTDDDTPTLSGTAEAGATVTIYDGDTVLGTVVAGEDGRWSFTPDALDEGSHSLSTTVTDLAGNVSERSPTFELTVDTIVNPVSDLQVTDNAGEDTG
ncbi:Ig-like domain-containing protein, partial [Klebsiella oxytoca]|uniref:Ig-like domain-containing protein n=1 Tax=Klebsiella oxytoca TaxID=571 RepID=UPI002930DF8F